MLRGSKVGDCWKQRMIAYDNRWKQLLNWKSKLIRKIGLSTKSVCDLQNYIRDEMRYSSNEKLPKLGFAVCFWFRVTNYLCWEVAPLCFRGGSMNSVRSWRCWETATTTQDLWSETREEWTRNCCGGIVRNVLFPPVVMSSPIVMWSDVSGMPWGVTASCWV